MPKATVDVQCPCCHSALKVDVATGVVLTHKEPERPKPIEDIGAAVAALKTQAARREEVFQKSVEEHKTHAEVLTKKFDELFKQARESPDDKPYRRDIDLD